MTTLESFDLYAVGGSVRDELLGLPVKDHDFTAVLKHSKQWELRSTFQHLGWELTQAGFEIFLEKPEYLTIRARFPKDHEHHTMVADFVLARKEGPYTDGRHPDWVKPGTLEDDLARRDFTMNAIARAEDGTLIDPYEGASAIKHQIITCVGLAEDRLREDALRGLRALRFAVTKGFFISGGIQRVLCEPWFHQALESVSEERKREELSKMFRHDTVDSMNWLLSFDDALVKTIFKDGLWLMPTLKDL